MRYRREPPERPLRREPRWNRRAGIAGLAALGALSGCAAHDETPVEPESSWHGESVSSDDENPDTCHREADNVPLSRLRGTIDRMQRECGMPPLPPPGAVPRNTLTPEESRRSCERLKAGGYVDDVDECMSHNGGWHQR